MNEQDLKNLWQTEQTAPQIDFARVEKLFNSLENKLRRNVRIEIAVQILTTIATLGSVIFYPKMIFFALSIIALCIWYVPELRGLYKMETQSDHLSVKELLNLKVRKLKNFFRRTRLVTYIFTPWAFILAYYGLGVLDDPKITASALLKYLMIVIPILEISVIIATEIYFKILYKPTLKKVENLLDELKFGE